MGVSGKLLITLICATLFSIMDLRTVQQASAYLNDGIPEANRMELPQEVLRTKNRLLVKVRNKPFLSSIPVLTEHLVNVYVPVHMATRF